MKAKVDGVPKNAQKPMEQFSVEEVQNWFKTFDEGKYADLAKNFAELNGDMMVNLSQDDCIRIAKNTAKGILIYNEWHPKVEGIVFFLISTLFFFHCLLFSCSSFVCDVSLIFIHLLFIFLVLKSCSTFCF